MKKISLLSIVALLVLSCGPQNNSTTAAHQDSSQSTVSCSTANQDSLQFLNTLDQETFNNLKNGWTGSNHTLVQPQGPVEYFSLPFTDIQELATLTAVDNIRIYIGKGQATQNDNGYRLMLMPVCSLTQSPNSNIILDYTNVCPPTCNNN